MHIYVCPVEVDKDKVCSSPWPQLFLSHIPLLMRAESPRRQALWFVVQAQDLIKLMPDKLKRGALTITLSKPIYVPVMYLLICQSFISCMHSYNFLTQRTLRVAKRIIPLSVMLGSPTCSVRTFPWFLSISTIFAYNWASIRPARMLPAKYIFLDMMFLGSWFGACAERWMQRSKVNHVAGFWGCLQLPSKLVALPCWEGHQSEERHSPEEEAYRLLPEEHQP